MESKRRHRAGGRLAALALCLAAIVPAGAAGASSTSGAASASFNSLLVKSGDMPAFRPTSTPFVPDDLTEWLDHLGYEGEERSRIEARLSELKWIAGVDLKLVPAVKGGKGEGIELLSEFESAAAAKREMKAELKEDVGPANLRPGEHVRFFRVPGAPGAKAFEIVDKGRGVAANVLFVKGPVFIVIGAYEPKGAARSNVVAGAQAVFARASG